MEFSDPSRTAEVWINPLYTKNSEWHHCIIFFLCSRKETGWLCWIYRMHTSTSACTPSTGSISYLHRKWFSMVPRVFKKTMVIIAAHLCLKGIVLFPYIKNWFLIVDSKDNLLRNTQTMLSLLQELELCVNQKKSNLALNTCIKFIGAILDTRVYKTFLFSS